MLVLLLEAPVRTCVRIFQPGGGYSGVVLYVEKRLFNGSIQTKIDFDARQWHVRTAGIASRRPFRLNCARGCRIFNLM